MSFNENSNDCVFSFFSCKHNNANKNTVNNNCYQADTLKPESVANLPPKHKYCKIEKHAKCFSFILCITSL